MSGPLAPKVKIRYMSQKQAISSYTKGEKTSMRESPEQIFQNCAQEESHDREQELHHLESLRTV